MQRVLTNPYKRRDIFACNHSAHHRFEGAVSAYYVLEEKGCYPDGCLNFIWRCKLLNKGQNCPKRFEHVGRKCFSCKQFFDEKYQQQPRLLLSDEQYSAFLREKEEFDYWVGEHLSRTVELEATVSGLKPNLVRVIRGSTQSYRLTGWVLILKNAFINYDRLDDICFAPISLRAQDTQKFAAGVRFEGRARFGFTRGRLTFDRLHDVEIIARGPCPPPQAERLSALALTASSFPVQPEKCVGCAMGVMTENPGHGEHHTGPRYGLVCLRGVKDPAACLYHLEPLLQE